MEESASAHPCQINYDAFHNMSQRDAVKFRRSYGSVQLNPREGEDDVELDEFGAIIEKIQEVNEDVFLTRECNNFDLINLDSSHSLSSNKFNPLHSDVNEHFNSLKSINDTPHEDITEGCSYSDHEINKVFDVEPLKKISSQQISEDKITSSGISNHDVDTEESRSHFLISERKSDSFVEPISDPIIPFFDDEKPSQQLMKQYSLTQESKREGKDMKSVRFRDNENILTSINYTQNSSSSNDDKSGKFETEDMDSDESSKWDKKLNDMTYNARYFYNSEDHKVEQKTSLLESYTKSDLTEEESAAVIINQLNDIKSDPNSNTAQSPRGGFFNDAFDNESLNSLDTSLSASSAFESAMSSNDMMSPFGTPRNSLSKHSSHSGTTYTNKKIGINFASLTSENIPNTLNRISMHKALEKSILKVPSQSTDRNDKTDRDSSYNIVGYNKIYSSHSIRKLLTLTSQKKSTEKPNKRECLNEGQLFKKDAPKTICLKTRDKKLNLREFYSSRRNKLKSLVETEKLNHRIISNSLDEAEINDESSLQNITIRSSKSVPVRSTKSNLYTDVEDKESVKDESKNILPGVTLIAKESKSKFVSKIPRPVSRKDIRQKQEMSINSVKSEDGRKHVHYPSTMTRLMNNDRSDRSETLSRPSDGSEYSYKATISKIKEERTNPKNGSKLIVNSAQIDSLRSKYWMKEDKISFSSVGSTLAKKDNKRVENKEKEKKKVKSHIYVAPQPMRQPSRLAYGKMVRVKTAPIKSSLPVRGEKSIVKEPSRPDTAYSLKPGRKLSKVVSIGALDANKIF